LLPTAGAGSTSSATTMCMASATTVSMASATTVSMASATTVSIASATTRSSSRSRCGSRLDRNGARHHHGHEELQEAAEQVAEGRVEVGGSEKPLRRRLHDCRHFVDGQGQRDAGLFGAFLDEAHDQVAHRAHVGGVALTHLRVAQRVQAELELEHVVVG